MLTTPPNPSTLLQPPSRLRSLCVFVVALMYAFVAALIAHRSANGLSSGDWVPLIDQLIFLFLLLVGFGALNMAFRRTPAAAGGSTRASVVSGLIRRPTALHEFGTGIAVGWGLLLVTILPAVLIGGLQISVSTSGRQWFLLVLDLAVLAVAALCSEVIFRSYPFRQLMDAAGTTLGALLVSVCFVVFHYQPEMPRTAVLSLFLFSLILCIAYVRTRALWLCWGLHFGWNAATGPLFGLPVGGYSGNVAGFSPVVQSLPLGQDLISGGDYGPEASVVAVLVLLFLGIWLVMRVTRDYAHMYGFPEMVPGGIPVDIDGAARRQHETAMGPTQLAEPKLVQIGDLPPAAAPPRREGDAYSS